MQPVFSAPAKLAGKQAGRKTIISLTPLIDVVFILLVFFMLASSFMDWHAINLDTAPAARTAVAETEPMVIAVRGDEVLLNNTPLALDALVAKALARQPADQPVSLQPLERTRVQQLVRVLDALNAAGIAPLKLVDDPNWLPAKSGDAVDMTSRGDKTDALP
jgi:biopolymer transport protein ExbD